MKPLFAPWRSRYSDTHTGTKKADCPASECPFCLQLAGSADQQAFILRRFTYNAVFLNLFPYNAGHLLIIPYEHRPRLSDFSSEIVTETILIARSTSRLLTDVLKAEGVNIGINIGQVSGAGIPSHLHMHVLPRWANDTNFLPVFGETKQISYDLTDIYKKLHPAINNLAL